MSDPRPVIAVVGPGAVGGLLAWLLHRAGEQVVAVGRDRTVAAIRANGIEVRSEAFGNGVEQVPASTGIPHGAAVIVATKTYGLADVLPSLAAAQPSEVLSLLNGVEHMATLREALPGVPVVGASIAVSALRASATVIDHRSPFTRIEVPESGDGFATVRALADAGASVRIGGTEAEVLWAKFRLLASMALLTSYWREPVGVALSTDPELTEAVLAEVAACSTAAGVPATAGEVAVVVRSVPAGMRTSLQEDLAAGNPNELDAIGGALIRIGETNGVPTPAIETIVSAVGGTLPR
ncbi:ketopantoate reductase family protein [Leifsonia poae]|uniref:2-dehydropantoate 2-reductase n=1 Tax=Leifsonia poae TaxID=110933 RepID=A0A9W6HCR0_9MICO|nr:2-dehydropantoate 2-reductase [Leifsonia poae]GLJ77665.1 2-dehydropantoate 2-reductase [Leifsonia poae]